MDISEQKTPENAYELDKNLKEFDSHPIYFIYWGGGIISRVC